MQPTPLLFHVIHDIGSILLTRVYLTGPRLSSCFYPLRTETGLLEDAEPEGVLAASTKLQRPHRNTMEVLSYDPG